jgi:hypothetical protein
VRGIDGVLKGYVRLASSSRLSSRSIFSSAGNSMVLKYLSENSLSSSLLIPSAISSVPILSFGMSSYSRVTGRDTQGPRTTDSSLITKITSDQN